MAIDWFTKAIRKLTQRVRPKQVTPRHANPPGNQLSSNGHIHPTEAEHRSAEQAYWHAQADIQKGISRVGWATLVFSGVAALATSLAYCAAKEQANIAQAALQEVRSGSAQTDKAIAAAEQTARAAMAQVEVSRDNAMKQLRHYVWVRLNDFPTLGADNKVSMRRRLSNTGRTAALNVQRIVEMSLVSTLPDNGAGLPYPSDQQVSAATGTNFISPDAEQEAYSFWPYVISPEAWNGVVTGTGLTFVEWGTVRYEDVFGRVHHLWFCSTWKGQGNPSQKCPRGNRID